MLGEALTAEPESPPVTFGPVAVSTSAGRTIEADIWFRCYGLTPVSDYLRGALASARLADGSIEVTPELQVTGQANVFAIGDVAAADLKTAGRAGREADIVVANIRALIEGGDLQTYEPMPPAIVIPLGPSGGASELPGQDEIAGAEATATIKGEHMFVDTYHELFGLATSAATTIGDRSPRASTMRFSMRRPLPRQRPSETEGDELAVRGSRPRRFLRR